MAKLVDGNSCYTPKRAIEVGRLLEAEGIGHFEEPCPYWEFAWTKEVTDALSIDVTGGEQDCEFTAWATMIGMRAVDVVQPDVMYLGGMLRTLHVCKMAEKAGLPVTPHAANLSLVTMCTMHLLRAIPNAGKYLEFSIEEEDYYPWQYGLFLGDPYRIADGKATIEEMALAAAARGYEFLCLTDHSHYLREGRLEQQWEEIDRVNALVAPFRVLRGVEANITARLDPAAAITACTTGTLTASPFAMLIWSASRSNVSCM